MVELVYVDEQPTEGNRIIRSAAASGYFEQNQVEFIEPLASIDDTLDEILSLHCKVLVTDYQLGHHNPDIAYTGADLVNAMKRRASDFPCFITTSYAGDAANEDVDVLSIFSKSDILEDEEDENESLPFFKRVRRYVDSYHGKMHDISTRHEELISLMNSNELGAEGAEELLKLDNIIESSLAGESAEPGHVKALALQPFGELVEKAQELIDQIESELRPERNRQN